jgi:hypothetical protein
MVVSSEAAAALTRMNAISVATLTGFVSLSLINVLRDPSDGAKVAHSH